MVYGVGTRDYDLIERHGFRGGLVFEAHRLLNHPTLGLREIKKKSFDVSLPARVVPCTCFQQTVQLWV